IPCAYSSIFFSTFRHPPRSTLFPTRRSSDLQGEPAGVDGGVEGIGLAAVLLVEDEQARASAGAVQGPQRLGGDRLRVGARHLVRSEEHTSELQSLAYLVCRLLLEKKKKNKTD